MKRQIHAPNQISNGLKVSGMSVDTIPNIDNKYLDLNVVLSWLDKLEEVQEHETNIGNN